MTSKRPIFAINDTLFNDCRSIELARLTNALQHMSSFELRQWLFHYQEGIIGWQPNHGLCGASVAMPND